MKVTIGIPVHNGEQWIATAVESGLNQTWPEKEIIVVDDGSTDQTPEICAGYQHDILYVRQERAGSNVARNHILNLAAGNWVQYLDAGDELLPTKVDVQLNSIPAGAEPEIIFSPHRLQRWHHSEPVGEPYSHYTSPHDPLRTWLRFEFSRLAALLIRREPLQEIGGWDESLSRAEHDELLLRAVLHRWRFHYVAHPLAIWHWSNQPWSLHQQNERHLTFASLIDRLQQELVNRGEWNRYLQALADHQRFRLARLIAATDLAAGLACYLTPKERNLIRYRYATSSWRIRSVFCLLGFERAERVARALRALRSPAPPTRRPEAAA